MNIRDFIEGIQGGGNAESRTILAQHEASKEHEEPTKADVMFLTRHKGEPFYLSEYLRMLKEFSMFSGKIRSTLLYMSGNEETKEDCVKALKLMDEVFNSIRGLARLKCGISPTNDYIDVGDAN